MTDAFEAAWPAIADHTANCSSRKPNGRANESFICEHPAPHEICSIPPRPWAYGYFLLFGHAGVIGAVDGGGKGALATVIGLSMITGRPLLGEHVWRTGPVAIISYEDDEAEWRRRIVSPDTFLPPVAVPERFQFPPIAIQHSQQG